MKIKCLLKTWMNIIFIFANISLNLLKTYMFSLYIISPESWDIDSLLNQNLNIQNTTGICMNKDIYQFFISVNNNNSKISDNTLVKKIINHQIKKL